MSFFERENLYRIEIIGTCYCSVISGLTHAMPSLESIEKKGNFGTIPVGTKGWVIKKFGKKYFRADENQDGIDLFTPANQPIALIPYRTIEGQYKKISEEE